MRNSLVAIPKLKLPMTDCEICRYSQHNEKYDEVSLERAAEFWAEPIFLDKPAARGSHSLNKEIDLGQVTKAKIPELLHRCWPLEPFFLNVYRTMRYLQAHLPRTIIIRWVHSINPSRSTDVRKAVTQTRQSAALLQIGRQGHWLVSMASAFVESLVYLWSLSLCQGCQFAKKDLAWRCV